MIESEPSVKVPTPKAQNTETKQADEPNTSFQHVERERLYQNKVSPITDKGQQTMDVNGFKQGPTHYREPHVQVKIGPKQVLPQVGLGDKIHYDGGSNHHQKAHRRKHGKKLANIVTYVDHSKCNDPDLPADGHIVPVDIFCPLCQKTLFTEVHPRGCPPISWEYDTVLTPTAKTTAQKVYNCLLPVLFMILLFPFLPFVIPVYTVLQCIKKHQLIHICTGCKRIIGRTIHNGKLR